MRMKPILFNTDMVRAILEGRKTVTRRVVKPQPKYQLRIRDKECYKDEWHEYSENPMADKFCNRPWGAQYIPPYRPGDIPYIPQAWKCVGIFGELGYEVEFRDGQRVKFKFESRERAKKWVKYRDKPACHWQSPYFMPREAARLFLRVTDMRVERLQDITEEQARAEGISPLMISTDVEKPDDEKEWHEWGPALPRFQIRWDRTIKSSDRAIYGWDANPWVWVIEFEQCGKQEETRK